ncbi:MAG: alanine/glycine:cation symporter family protein, partial [Bacteroidota bacterium]
TVGIGNIAGVAIAIHWGGPGAVFWMWVTAILGMATKFSEVSLAQKYRITDTDGATAGGPMYYIERGLGPRWKPMAMFFALALITMAFISGNAIQANTLADLLATAYQIPNWLTGLITASIVGLVIIGGITRIGKVTSILAPSMAALYILGGLAVLFTNADQILPAFQLIITEAFTPTAGVAGTGAGVFMQTLIWGVRRGLFSNEAGQGSAPIAHAAAKTEEPVSEGVVALLEPLIDTVIICTVTALVIITSGVWRDTTPTVIDLTASEIAFIDPSADLYAPRNAPDSIHVLAGQQQGEVQLSWHEVTVQGFFTDEARQLPFSGILLPAQSLARDQNGQVYTQLYAPAVENAAPLTMWAYRSALGGLGGFIVLICVVLFAISTAISWSYYGDRCTTYLFGKTAILPYRLIYVGMHFMGAILSLNLIWELGDLAMAMGTLPNVLALLLLSGVVKKMADRYFKR